MSVKNIRLKLIYILSAGFLIILTLEGLIRLLGIAPKLNTHYGYYVDDPYLPYKPEPFSKITGQEEEFDFDYNHNSLGFRDEEHSIHKSEGTFRILGLGDSFTYGVGAPFEHTFLYLLESMFNNRENRDKEIEIIKAGIPRFFPEPERLLFEHYGLQFKPDLILLAFSQNDIVDTHLGLDAVKVDNKGYLFRAGDFSEISHWFYTNSHIFRIIFSRFFSVDRPSEKEKTIALEKIRSEYAKMNELATKINAKLVVIHIPPKGPWNDEMRNVISTLSEWGSSQNIPFIDVLPAMEKASQNQVLYWKKDGHCNPAGYKLIAETIFSHLVENNLVP